MTSSMMAAPADASFHMAGLYFHCFFSIVAAVGLILLVAWMIKNLKPEKLLWWAVGLTVLGFIGALITIQYEAGFLRKMYGKFDGKQMMNMMQSGDKNPQMPFSSVEMQPGMMMKMMDTMTEQNLP
jgi:hypothetical protein